MTLAFPTTVDPKEASAAAEKAHTAEETDPPKTGKMNLIDIMLLDRNDRRYRTAPGLPDALRVTQTTIDPEVLRMQQRMQEMNRPAASPQNPNLPPPLFAAAGVPNPSLSVPHQMQAPPPPLPPVYVPPPPAPMQQAQATAEQERWRRKEEEEDRAFGLAKAPGLGVMGSIGEVKVTVSEHERAQEVKRAQEEQRRLMEIYMEKARRESQNKAEESFEIMKRRMEQQKQQEMQQMNRVRGSLAEDMERMQQWRLQMRKSHDTKRYVGDDAVNAPAAPSPPVQSAARFIPEPQQPQQPRIPDLRNVPSVDDDDDDGKLQPNFQLPTMPSVTVHSRPPTAEELRAEAESRLAILQQQQQLLKQQELEEQRFEAASVHKKHDEEVEERRQRMNMAAAAHDMAIRNRLMKQQPGP